MDDRNCTDFTCSKKGRCINEDMLCEALVGCRLIRTEEERCSLCLLSRSCPARLRRRNSDREGR